MIESSKVHKILYGGDYNPEQWPEEIWKEDMRLFKLAHIDVVIGLAAAQLEHNDCAGKGHRRDNT